MQGGARPGGVLGVVVMSLDFIQNETIDGFFYTQSGKIRFPFQWDHSGCYLESMLRGQGVGEVRTLDGPCCGESRWDRERDQTDGEKNINNTRNTQVKENRFVTSKCPI